MIVAHPLRVIRKFGEASFKPSQFSRVIGVVRHPHQLGVFNRLGAVLIGSEHGEPFVETSKSNAELGAIAERRLYRIAHQSRSALKRIAV